MDAQLKSLLLNGANRKLFLRFPDATDTSFITVETDEDPINVGLHSAIVSGSVNLSRVLCSKDYLAFGECNPAKLEITVSNIADVTGMNIELCQMVDGWPDEVPLFSGTIERATLQPNRKSRRIIAYDALYFLKEKNVADWIRERFPAGKDTRYIGDWSSTGKYVYPNIVSYNGSYYMYICTEGDVEVEVIYDPATFSDKEIEKRIFEVLQGMNPEEILDSDYDIFISKIESYSPDVTSTAFFDFNSLAHDLLEYVGLEAEDFDLPNATVQTVYDPKLSTFGSCIEAICQANACFGQIAPNGKFRFVFVGTHSESFTGNVRRESAYAEVITPAVNRVVVYDKNYSEKCSAGDGKNEWLIYGNHLLESTTDTGIAQTLLGVVSGLSYTSADLRPIISLPVDLGDEITFTTRDGTVIKTFALRENLSGVQLIHQEIEAGGQMRKDEVTQDQRLDAAESAARDYSAYKDAIFKMIESLRATFQLVRAQNAEVTELLTKRITATEARFETLTINDIKAGQIQSNDFQSVVIPLVYPQTGLYPSANTYSSSGEEVISGFAIDFVSGIIKGAFYNAQIAALEDRVTALEQIIGNS